MAIGPMTQRALRTQVKRRKPVVSRTILSQTGPKNKGIYFVRATHRTRASADRRAAELRKKGYDVAVKARRTGAYRYKVMQRVLWL